MQKTNISIQFGVNLYSLMERHSFMRDCGSIPHKDPTIETNHF